MYNGVVVQALVRDGKPEDARPGKPQPRYVFNVLIKGVDKPVITVRLSALGASTCRAARPCANVQPTAADAVPVMDADAAPATSAAIREAALARLPGSPEAYKDVPTEALASLPDFRAPPEEAAGPSGAAGGGGSAAAPGSTAAPAAAVAGSAAAAAPAGAPAANQKPMVRNPLSCVVMHNEEARICVNSAHCVQPDALRCRAGLLSGADCVEGAHECLHSRRLHVPRRL